MAVADAYAEAAERLTPKLRDYATGLGLPRELAMSLSLQFTEDGLDIVSERGDDIAPYEYGDENTPPLAPVRKAANRIEHEAAVLIATLVREKALLEVEDVTL